MSVSILSPSADKQPGWQNSVVIPQVSVLMTTWNAIQWLPDQLATIREQEDVAVTLIVSDDQSTDGSLQFLERHAAQLELTLLPQQKLRFGNANRNFLHLVLNATLNNAEYVAFADHDDVWMPRKLISAIHCIQTGNLDACSSDVLAFWDDGRERLLGKANSQRAHDHLFESAGPGCTFVLTRTAFESLRRFVQTRYRDAAAVKVHDWLIYAFARNAGWKWLIQPQPSMFYRQHRGNEIGANVGWKAIHTRWRSLRSGEYRNQALQIAELIGDGSEVTRRLRRFNLIDRVVLSVTARQCRRTARDALALAIAFLLMKRL